MPKKPRNGSVHVRERLEQGEQENSPERAPEDPDELGGETAALGDHQDHQGCPEDDGKRRDGDTNAPCQDTVPGDPRGQPEASGDVEGVRDRRKVVDDADYNGIGPRNDGDEHGVETDALRRDKGPGDPESEHEAMGDVERDRRRRNGVEGVGHDGGRWGMDGATSAARRDSKRVETDALAGFKASQHGQYERATDHVPGPSNPPPNHPIRPHTNPNPPRRRGRLKMRPTSVSTHRPTHQGLRARQSRTGRIGRAVYVVYGPYDGVGAIPDCDTRRRGRSSRSRTSART